MKQWKTKAVLTVEAAVLIPALIFLFAIVMRTGMALYVETKEISSQVITQSEQEILKIFYQKKGIEEVINRGN